MSGSRGYAVFVSACVDATALARNVAPLVRAARELTVAIDGANEPPLSAPLPVRWAAARAAVASFANAWVTPLVRTPSLPTLSDQCAALSARLGRIDVLYTDSLPWFACAQQLGMAVEWVAERHEPEPCAPPTASTSRALVVTRAQPFHRGHLALVQHALTRADEVILVVAAAERAFSVRDPFTAGERLALVRAGLGALRERVWLLSLPAPPWPAMALSELPFFVPRFDCVVAHNPVLRAMAQQQGTRVSGLEQLFAIDHQVLSATQVRERLAREGAGAWLRELLPEGTAELLATVPSLAERCALIAAAEA